MSLLNLRRSQAADGIDVPDEAAIVQSKHALLAKIAELNDQIAHLRNSNEHLERKISERLTAGDRAAYNSAHHGPVPLSTARENAQLRRNLLAAENRIAAFEGRPVQTLSGEFPVPNGVRADLGAPRGLMARNHEPYVPRVLSGAVYPELASRGMMFDFIDAANAMGLGDLLAERGIVVVSPPCPMPFSIAEDTPRAGETP